MGPGRFRFFVGVLVCFALPLGSKLVADGALAYTMYAGTVVYRVEIVAHDGGGRSLPIAPTGLARFTGPFAAPFLFDAERPRAFPQINALRAHLAEVGGVACAHTKATTVDVTLFEGADASTLTARTASVVCRMAP